MFIFVDRKYMKGFYEFFFRDEIVETDNELIFSISMRWLIISVITNNNYKKSV